MEHSQLHSPRPERRRAQQLYGSGSSLGAATAKGPELRRVDQRRIPNSRVEVRASMIVRNEALRLPAVLAHHRKIGVDRFFIVDNGSTDGTVDALLGEADVHLFVTDAPFRTRKAHWRHAIIEEFFHEGWGLHLDADELFVYPGMEELDLHRFCGFLERENVSGIFSVLVDMYAKESVDQVPYRPGDSLIERFPFFDRDGYHLRFRGKRRRREVAPAFQISGGPRERVFFSQRSAPWSRALARRLYDIRRNEPHRVVRIPALGSLLNSWARRALPQYAPNCGKVPLLRWRRGFGIQVRCLEALHEVEPRIPLSRCWAALLHFKNIPGIRERVQEAAEKKLYGHADAEYARYHEVLQETEELILFGPESTAFGSTRDLLRAGLMRSMPEFDAYVAAVREEGSRGA